MVLPWTDVDFARKLLKQWMIEDGIMTLNIVNRIVVNLANHADLEIFPPNIVLQSIKKSK